MHRTHAGTRGHAPRRLRPATTKSGRDSTLRSTPQGVFVVAGSSETSVNLNSRQTTSPAYHAKPLRYVRKALHQSTTCCGLQLLFLPQLTYQGRSPMIKLGRFKCDPGFSICVGGRKSGQHFLVLELTNVVSFTTYRCTKHALK